MAKKSFNIQGIADDLAQSAFFTRPKLVKMPLSQLVPPEPKNPVTQQPGNPASPQPKIQSPVELPIPRSALFKFDLEAKAGLTKHTTYLTEQEQELLEDLKIDVRRGYGHKTTKQDIIRCALADLVEDFQQHGADSRFIQRLKQQDHTKK